MPRTEKLDKVFSQLETKLEGFTKTKAYEWLIVKNCKPSLSPYSYLTKWEGIVCKQEPCRRKPLKNYEEDVNDPIESIFFLQNTMSTWLEDTILEVKVKQCQTNSSRQEKNKAFEDQIGSKKLPPIDRTNTDCVATNSNLNLSFGSLINFENLSVFKWTPSADKIGNNFLLSS